MQARNRVDQLAFDLGDNPSSRSKPVADLRVRITAWVHPDTEAAIVREAMRTHKGNVSAWIRDALNKAVDKR